MINTFSSNERETLWIPSARALALAIMAFASPKNIKKMSNHCVVEHPFNNGNLRDTYYFSRSCGNFLTKSKQ